MRCNEREQQWWDDGEGRQDNAGTWNEQHCNISTVYKSSDTLGPSPDSISNVPLAITFLFAIVGWWTAFIGQIVYENKYDQVTTGRGSAVGVSWFCKSYPFLSSLWLLSGAG